MTQKFRLVSDYQPTGDQPTAIKQLIAGLEVGEKEQVLLGVTGSGKSVIGETLVTIRRCGIVFQASIATIIDEIFTNYFAKTQQSNDSQFIQMSDVSYLDKFETWSFNQHTGINGWNKVTQVSRHTTNQIIKVVTTCGRSVTSTMDHNFYVVSDGIFHLVNGENIKIGDMLPVPRNLPGIDDELKSINIFDYIDDTDRLYVSLQNDLSMSDIKPYTMLSYRKRWAIIHKSERLLVRDYIASGMIKDLNNLAVKIGTNKYAAQVPISIGLSPIFLRFLGYYCLLYTSPSPRD